MILIATIIVFGVITMIIPVLSFFLLRKVMDWFPYPGFQHTCFEGTKEYYDKYKNVPWQDQSWSAIDYIKTTIAANIIHTEAKTKEVACDREQVVKLLESMGVTNNVRLWTYETVLGRLQDCRMIGNVGDIGDGGCLITLRGTSDMEEWYMDFLPRSIDAQIDIGKGARVSEGFYKHAYRAGCVGKFNLITQILNEVKKRNPKYIIINGHSLGSALSVLSAFELAKHGYNVIAVWILGAPKIGNSRFTEEYNNTKTGDHTLGDVTYNVGCVHDPILLLPKSTDIFNKNHWFHYAGKLIYLKDDLKRYSMKGHALSRYIRFGGEQMFGIPALPGNLDEKV